MQAPGISDVSGKPGSAYRCLDVEIDPVTASVYRAGEPVELRAKALQVLLFLIEQRHRLVSKEEIFERAWPGTTVVDATLAGCIQEIRKALADDAKDPRFIKTLPKLGYRFIAPLEATLPAAVPVVGSIKPQPVENVTPVNFRRRAQALGVVGLLALGIAVVSVFRNPATPADDAYAEVAWWKLDGGVANSSGSRGLDGVATGGAWESGVIGGSLRLDGKDQRVEGVDRQGILPRGNSPRTLAAWVKVASANGDTTGIVHYGTPRADVRDSFRLSLLPDGRPSFTHHAFGGLGDDRSMSIGGARIDDGEWHHLAGTFTGDRGALYVDGVQQAVVGMPPETRTPPDRELRWVLGNTVAGHHTGFRDALDDVRIWRRALRPGEIAALHRCSAGIADVTAPGGATYFYSPIWDVPLRDSWSVTSVKTGAGPDAPLVHAHNDYGGAQLVRRTQDCAVTSLRGADVGQDLSISVELLVPKTADGSALQAGPYFRSRAAAPGDGIMGGRSAGYWVQLHSTGAVTVRCLNPTHIVAFTKPDDTFDPSVFHKLDAAVRAETLEVTLDGRKLMFDQGGQATMLVKIPSEWEGPPAIGKNQGAAGIAFSSEPLRPKTSGGQQARRFSIH